MHKKGNVSLLRSELDERLTSADFVIGGLLYSDWRSFYDAIEYQSFLHQLSVCDTIKLYLVHRYKKYFMYDEIYYLSACLFILYCLL